MSWESTELYYRLINEETRRRCGGLHSAPIAMVSVDFQEIETHQHNGDWAAAAEILAHHSTKVEAAGADFLVICTNTMHKVADEIAGAINIPLLHVADATAAQLLSDGVKTVGLLGTRFTMEDDFYAARLRQHGLDVLTPDADDRTVIHEVIYQELCLGMVRAKSRKAFVRIIEQLKAGGADGVIQGCTEIVLLVQQQHTPVSLFDTTAIHAHAAVTAALGQRD